MRFIKILLLIKLFKKVKMIFFKMCNYEIVLRLKNIIFVYRFVLNIMCLYFMYIKIMIL